MSPFRQCVLLVVVLILSGCATMVELSEAERSLQQAQACCDDRLAQLEYVPLRTGEGIRFNLDASSPVFRFATGKSYFKAFRLPDQPLPYRIRLQSFALGEHIDKAHIFYPQLVLLDSDHQELWRSPGDSFKLSRAGFSETAEKTWGLPVKLEATFPIIDPRASYLLVRTTDELLQGVEPYVVMRATTVIVPGIVTMLPVGKEPIKIPHSPFALLYLEVLQEPMAE